MRWITLWTLLLLHCVGFPLRGDAQEPVPRDTSRQSVVLSMVPVDDVASQFKESLLKGWPETLEFTVDRNWGHQAHVPSLQGLKPVDVLRNHGNWERARVASWKLPEYLSLHVSDVQSPEENRVAFTVSLLTPATVDLDWQIWQNGLEIFADHVRARLRLTAVVRIEAMVTPLATDTPVPHRDISLLVTRATFGCTDFVTENVNGLGGDFARISGTLRPFTAWQPPILRKFQEAVLTAVQTASSTSEVRPSLTQLVARSLATRATILQVQGSGASTQLVESPPDVLVVPAAPIFLCGGMTIQVPLLIESTARSRHGLALPREHAEYLAHWRLVRHTIHYVPPAHGGQTSGSGSTAHHKDSGHTK
jgi:hypothetical protein